MWLPLLLNVFLGLLAVLWWWCIQHFKHATSSHYIHTWPIPISTYWTLCSGDFCQMEQFLIFVFSESAPNHKSSTYFPITSISFIYWWIYRTFHKLICELDKRLWNFQQIKTSKNTFGHWAFNYLRLMSCWCFVNGIRFQFTSAVFLA